MRANTLFFAILGTSVLLTGCFSRDTQPGDLQPGSMGEVAASSEGGGSAATSPLAKAKTTELSFGPSVAGVPYRYNERIATMYFYETEMASEDAIRSGFFVSLVVSSGKWAITKSRYDDNLNLGIMNNMRLDENGRVVITNPEPLDPNMASGFRRMGSTAFPFTPGDQDRAVTRTTVVYPDGRAESQVKALPSAPIFDPNVTSKQVLDSINAAKQVASQIQANSANSPGSNMVNGAGAPPPSK